MRLAHTPQIGWQPALGSCTLDLQALSKLLKERGMDVEIAPITRLDWSRNAAALTDGVYHPLLRPFAINTFLGESVWVHERSSEVNHHLEVKYGCKLAIWTKRAQVYYL